MTNKIIAIDPGSKGALAVMTEEGGKISIVSVMDIPIVIMALGSTRSMPDVTSLQHSFTNIDPQVIVIERVNAGPSDGRGSAGAFMLNFGAIIGAAASFDRRLIMPAKWKAFVGLVGRPKQASVNKVLDLYPEADKFLSKTKNKVDRADAILIGHYYLKYLRPKEM